MPQKVPVTGARSRADASQSMLATPNVPTTVAPPGRHSNNQPQISDLITHIAKQDNHLWQALSSLQAQTNQIAGSTTVWSAWNPQISNGTIPLNPGAMAAYYAIINNQTLQVQLNCQNMVVTANTTAFQILLPMSIGRVVIQTCAAYLPDFSTNINLVIGVQAYDNIIDVFLRPVPGGYYEFMLGGSFLIFQGGPTSG